MSGAFVLGLLQETARGLFRTNVCLCIHERTAIRERQATRQWRSTRRPRNTTENPTTTPSRESWRRSHELAARRRISTRPRERQNICRSATHQRHHALRGAHRHGIPQRSNGFELVSIACHGNHHKRREYLMTRPHQLTKTCLCVRRAPTFVGLFLMSCIPLCSDEMPHWRSEQPDTSGLLCALSWEKPSAENLGLRAQKKGATKLSTRNSFLNQQYSPRMY